MCPLCRVGAVFRDRRGGDAWGGVSSHTADGNENICTHHEFVVMVRLTEGLSWQPYTHRHKQLGSLCCTSLSSASAAFPSSLPIRAPLHLPRWLHPPSLWQRRGGHYWLKLQGVFSHTCYDSSLQHSTSVGSKESCADMFLCLCFPGSSRGFSQNFILSLNASLSVM